MKTEESQFISLAAAAKMTNYSQDYISLLCRQGKLKAEKLGRNWVTTKEWVYEYVDKTEGKGASIVPVKIKEAEKKEMVAAKVNVAEKGAERRPLFGSMVLELAIFCTVSVILLANTIGFSAGIKEVNDNFNIVQRFITYQNYMLSKKVTNDTNAIDNSEQSLTGASDIDSQTCSGAPVGTPVGAIDLIAFDKETDAAVIAGVTSKITANITEPVTVEVYKGFAVVSYTSDPTKKLLYVTKK